MEPTVKRLTRSRRDRVFAGVCGGMATYLAWDVVLVRVAWIALTILSAGLGIALYLLAWLVVPLEDFGQSQEPAHAAKVSSDTRTVLGVLAVVIGLLALGSSMLPWFWRLSSFRVVGPLILIVIGAALLLRPSTSSGAGTNAPTASADEESGEKGTKVPKHAARRLVRIHRGRKIAGVCNGLGAYFGVDPTVVRLLWIALALAGGVGILLYVLFWIAMPLVEEPPDNSTG
jgi:phage shock protein C